MKSIRSWANEIHANSIDRGWWQEGDERAMGDVISNIHSEVSEAWEDYRDDKMDVTLCDDGKPVGFWTEIADIMIRCLDLCGKHDVDIEHIMALKHQYNKTRSYRHGGKRA